jgi:hypothetical protein
MTRGRSQRRQTEWKREEKYIHRSFGHPCMGILGTVDKS